MTQRALAATSLPGHSVPGNCCINMLVTIALKRTGNVSQAIYTIHSFSAASATWTNIPYPYSPLLYSGIYDGDTVIGKGFTQPDKAGSFDRELVKLHQMMGSKSHGKTPAAI